VNLLEITCSLDEGWAFREQNIDTYRQLGMCGITFQLGCSISADRNDSNEATQNCYNACNKPGVSYFLFEVFVFRCRSSDVSSINVMFA
jgi:hypothetical protein